MNVKIGTEAVQFLFWEHINGIFVAMLIRQHLRLKEFSTTDYDSGEISWPSFSRRTVSRTTIFGGGPSPSALKDGDSPAVAAASKQ
jgi:hypothetical protein